MRIGVCASNAVFNSGGRTIFVWNANGGAAVAKAIVDINRCKRTRLEAAVAIGKWRKNRLRIKHGVEHACTNAFQLSGFTAFGIENVVAVLIDQADVDMQARACLICIGLGHAGAFHAVVARSLFNKAFKINAFVGRGHCVSAVEKIDLELTGAKFCRGGING